MCGQQTQSNDPGNNQHHPQYANYWAPLTRKRHIPPHSAQSQHANYWALRTLKRHQQEHRPQRPTESSDPTQHAKGRTGDRPGPRKGATTRRNVTQGDALKGGGYPPCGIPSGCWFFTGPWTVTRSSLRMLHRVTAVSRPLQPVFFVVSFSRCRGPVVGCTGVVLVWLWCFVWG